MICPKCGSTSVTTYEGNGYHRCYHCNHKWDIEPDLNSNNPYTEFAKEMSLLHEALKAEGFYDSVIPIMQAMTPEVWKKVQFEEQKHFLHKAFGIDIDRMIKEINEDNRKREDDNWQRIRKEVMCDESSS